MTRRRHFNQPKHPGAWFEASLPDGEWLTQYGSTESPQTFRSKPRWPSESTLSMVRGRASVEVVTQMVRKRSATEFDTVRYITVGSMRAAGFMVITAPTAQNPLHMSIGVPKGGGKWENRDWTAAEELRFIEAFDDDGKEIEDERADDE